jgi:regulator of protease activity HflC (stomatin/prohibitin superfamily)
VPQFDKPIRVITDPGLRIKQPFIQNVIVYDKRLLDFEPPPEEEVIASDQKRLIVDTYACYRITNPLLFYQTAASEPTAPARLGALVSGSLRQVIGNVTLSALLSRQRSAIMRPIRDEVPLIRQNRSALMSSMSASGAPTCRRRTARRSMPACTPSASSRRPCTAARARRRQR